MISEGSWYTKDWSNDAENSALQQRNKSYFKLYYNRNILYIMKIMKYYIIIFLNISFFQYFWSNKGSLDKHKRLLSSNK